jgi:hypothetical protein
METIGLIPSQQTRANTTSTLYLRKGEPIITPSPLLIQSADGINEMELSVANDGTCDIIASTAGINISSTSDIYLKADGTNLVGIVMEPTTDDGNCAFTMNNGSVGDASGTSYTFYNPSTTGGGLTAGELAIFGYSGSGPNIKRCFQTTPLGDEILLGDDSVVDGAIVKVCGASGEGRVLDSIYNKPTVADNFTVSNNLITNKLTLGPTSQYGGQVNLTGTSVTIGIASGISNSSLFFLNSNGEAPIGKLFTTYVNETSFTINSTESETGVPVQYFVINQFQN